MPREGQAFEWDSYKGYAAGTAEAVADIHKPRELAGPVEHKFVVARALEAAVFNKKLRPGLAQYLLQQEGHRL